MRLFFTISVDFEWVVMREEGKWEHIYKRENQKKKIETEFPLTKVFVLRFDIYIWRPMTGESPPWDVFQIRKRDEILGVYIDGLNLVVKFKMG